MSDVSKGRLISEIIAMTKRLGVQPRTSDDTIPLAMCGEKKLERIAHNLRKECAKKGV